MRPGAEEVPRWLRSIGISAIFTFGLWMLTGRSQLTDDQINYIAIADQILDPTGPAVSWIPYRTFSFLIAAVSSITSDHVTTIKIIYAGCAFLYFIAMAKFLGIFFKRGPVVWATALLSITPGYTLGMTFWGFGGFEYVLARSLLMPLVPWILYLFWEPTKPLKRSSALLLCAAGAAVSFEALLLLAILILCLLVEAVRDKRVRSDFRGVLGWGIIGAIVAGTFIFIYPELHGQDPFFNLTPIYENIIAANARFLQSMSQVNFVDLYWRAGYAACWWTMFPPRMTDVLFVLMNQAPLIIAAGFGWNLLRVSDRVTARRLVFWSVITVIIAYGYPLLRYAGWKLFLLPPHIFEEVRAIKFVHPVLFVCVGTLLDRLWVKQATITFAAVVVLLCISPVSAIRQLPADFKQNAYNTLSRYIHEPDKLRYAAKALALEDADPKLDYDRIIESIRDIVPDDKFVLSTYYPLRLTGKKIIMLYNDKRNGGQPIGGNIYPRLPYWYIAYQEVSEALNSCDELKISAVVKKYQTDYVVAPCALAGPQWRVLTAGRHVSLYHFLPDQRTSNEDFQATRSYDR